MSHRTWIVVLMNCVSFVHSLFRATNLRSSSMIARRFWFFDEKNLNDDCSIKDSSDDSTESVIDDSTESLTDDSTESLIDDSIESSSDDSTESSFDNSFDNSFRDSSDNSFSDSSRCFKFSMMKNDFLFVNWFFDAMNDCLYDEMKNNRLYNCLLNENSDDWKNFENRNNEIDCLLVDWFFDENDKRIFDENDEIKRDKIDDENLRLKFVFKRILMIMKMKFSWDKCLNISSSIHLREIFFWRMLYRVFSIMIFSSFDIHTSRLRKVFRNRRKKVFETFNLKFFSIHSSKFFWNCFHNSLFMRLYVSHFLIFVSTQFFQFWIFFISSFNFDCDSTLQE